MPDPASTKQTTADLVAELRDHARQYREDDGTEPRMLRVAARDCELAADALKALAAENERLRGVEERAKAYLDFKHMPEVILIAVRRILHGEANAGGGDNG